VTAICYPANGSIARSQRTEIGVEKGSDKRSSRSASNGNGNGNEK
jgi:hypothetical protein